MFAPSATFTFGSIAEKCIHALHLPLLLPKDLQYPKPEARVFLQTFMIPPDKSTYKREGPRECSTLQLRHQMGPENGWTLPNLGLGTQLLPSHHFCHFWAMWLTKLALDHLFFCLGFWQNWMKRNPVPIKPLTVPWPLTIIESCVEDIFQHVSE